MIYDVVGLHMSFFIYICMLAFFLSFVIFPQFKHFIQICKSILKLYLYEKKKIEVEDSIYFNRKL